MLTVAKLSGQTIIEQNYIIEKDIFHSFNLWQFFHLGNSLSVISHQNVSFLWWCNERFHAMKPFSYHFIGKKILLEWVQNIPLRWLNTVLTVCDHMSFAKSWQEKGCSSQAETWKVKNILMKDFDWQVKCDVFVVSTATWTIEYNLKIILLLSLHKIRSLDSPINFNTALYYNSPCETYLTKS